MIFTDKRPNRGDNIRSLTIDVVPVVVALAPAVSDQTVLLLQTADVDQPAPVQRALLPGVRPGGGHVRVEILVPGLYRDIISIILSHISHFTSHSSSCQCGALSQLALKTIDPRKIIQMFILRILTIE